MYALLLYITILILLESNEGPYLRLSIALIGVILFALAGWLIGAVLEHPVGPGGLEFICALVGVVVAVGVLALGEALKHRE
jgi:thiol:disulfide interchange protein